jgi:hypothetical protein
MNWASVAGRKRIARQGVETVNGQAIGSTRMPSASPDQQQKTPSRCRTLSEPVIVDRFWANRQHDAVVVTLSTFKNYNMIDLRKHAMDRDGKLVPTSKGLALKLARLPDLARAIQKALTCAHELGLLTDEAAE